MIYTTELKYSKMVMRIPIVYFNKFWGHVEQRQRVKIWTGWGSILSFKQQAKIQAIFSSLSPTYKAALECLNRVYLQYPDMAMKWGRFRKSGVGRILITCTVTVFITVKLPAPVKYSLSRFTMKCWSDSAFSEQFRAISFKYFSFLN